MIRHTDFESIFSGKKQLWQQIAEGKINWGGNSCLKIYGTLSCKSGKRMLRGNRVFFATEQEAVMSGFRPCGHCMWQEYQQWKNMKDN